MLSAAGYVFGDLLGKRQVASLWLKKRREKIQGCVFDRKTDYFWSVRRP